ncbi:universal stress protein [Oscillatoria sp. FACHB-1407]|uniref:universal stress protein n=1 Tax=Oscillatoria sp. FACHB-1407 TaxID=2692847 RepID=UPI0016853785|nr:universal stress protein [Oscillatoria sp. FACHB-1407]MBD2460714.1 universal stress protein [Oscillatoria sp. FACHB-1407]
MFQRCLICTDFSDGLQRLVNCVSDLAAHGLTQIVFLHVLAMSNEQEVPRLDAAKEKQARDRLSPALDQVPPGVEVKVEVKWGRITDQILAVSKANQTELLVLGMETNTLLGEKLFGSTTMEICQQRAIPTLILRPQLISTYTREELQLRCRHLLRSLLLPYNGSNNSNYLVEQVKQYSQRHPVKALESCLLCWVVDEVSRAKELEGRELKRAEEELVKAKANLETAGITVRSQIRKGNAVVQTLLAPQEEDISAIAISSESIGKLLRWSSPSFAAEILRRSWYPVLYLPENE